MKAGPKAVVDPSPLPFVTRKRGAARLAAFCAKFVVTLTSTGARRPIRMWLRQLTGWGP